MIHLVPLPDLFLTPSFNKDLAKKKVFLSQMSNNQKEVSMRSVQRQEMKSIAQDYLNPKDWYA